MSSRRFANPRALDPLPLLRLGLGQAVLVGWYAVVQDDMNLHDGRVMPRGAIVRYREWYGWNGHDPDVGLQADGGGGGRGHCFT